MLYLTSTEYERLTGPIACEIVSNMLVKKRQALIVKIEPPLAGIDYGRGLRAINYLVLIAKYNDAEIKNLNKFPIDVVVFLPDYIEEPLKIERKWSKMDSIGWAELNENL
jgi:hypothetical protein